jgi:hypothetical protein
MVVSYMLQFLDKQSLSQSSIMGFIVDLVRMNIPLEKHSTDFRLLETHWQRILMVWLNILFRLPNSILSRFIADGETTYWEIPRSQLVRESFYNTGRIRLISCQLNLGCHIGLPRSHK